MSSNSQITSRNGKILTSTTSAESTELTRSEQIVNMENDNENVDDQAQSRQSSSGPEIDSQKANDERFSHLQSELSMLKAIMEKLLEQSEERNRQTDTNAATSSFAVRSSNSCSPPVLDWDELISRTKTEAFSVANKEDIEGRANCQLIMESVSA